VRRPAVAALAAVLAVPALVLGALLVVFMAAGSTTAGTAALAAACSSAGTTSSSSPDTGCVTGDDEGDGLPDDTSSSASLPAGYTFPPGTTAAERRAISFAVAQLGKPYRWGATGPDAWDCSGMVQAAWRAAGIAISRTTLTQIHDGSPVPSLAELAPGDLVFIAGSEGTMTVPRHVGMYIGRSLIIEAPHTGDVIKIVSLSRWAPLIAAMRHIA
jgi:cell wall-associated NlpC family hydrolase